MRTDFHHIYFIYAPVILIISIVVRFLRPKTRLLWWMEIVLLFVLAVVPVFVYNSDVYEGSHVKQYSPIVLVTIIYAINFIIVLALRPGKLWDRLAVRRVAGGVLIASRVWPLYMAYLFLLLSHK